MPRPPIDPDRLRVVQLRVRLTAAEAGDLASRAVACRLTLGDFVRRASLGVPLPIPVPEINRTAWTELSRLASNLNQLAHAANSGQPVAVDTAMLREIAGLVALLRRRLIGQ